MSGLDEIPEMMACATWRGAKTLGVEDEYGIEEGKPVPRLFHEDREETITFSPPATGA